jgi:hypothetical protein
MSSSLTVGASPASAAETGPSAVSGFDARAVASPGGYCIDVPQILVGQQICGGMLESTVLATSDPRGYALGGLAPVPKLSSVPLLIPQTVPVLGLPVPKEIQEALKSVKYDNTPAQCQALFPPLRPGDAEQTCGGPTAGDAPAGIIASAANAHVQTSGVPDDALQTHARAETRAQDVKFPGLQSTAQSAYAHAEGGLGEGGVPQAVAVVKASGLSLAGGLLTLDGVWSRTAIGFDGTKAGTTVTTDFAVESASVVGVPVIITPSGVTVNTTRVPAAAAAGLMQRVNDALTDRGGLTIRLLPAPPIQRSESQVTAGSGGVEIMYHGTTGTEVTYRQVIGYTTASVTAVPVGEAGPGGIDGDGSGSGGSTTGGSLTTDAGGPAALPGLSGSGTDPTTGAVDSPILAGPGGISPPMSQRLGDPLRLQSFTAHAPLSADRMRDIYTAFLSLAFATFVLTRWQRSPLLERISQVTPWRRTART